jgi:hypothetical protein
MPDNLQKLFLRDARVDREGDFKCVMVYVEGSVVGFESPDVPDQLLAMEVVREEVEEEVGGVVPRAISKEG